MPPRKDWTLVYISSALFIITLAIAAVTYLAVAEAPGTNNVEIGVVVSLATAALLQVWNLINTNQARQETRAARSEIVEAKASIQETKAVATETHKNAETVRLDVNDKMQKMQDEIRMASYAPGVKDTEGRYKQEQAQAQAVSDAAKVQVYEQAAVASALPSVPSSAPLTVEQLSAVVMHNKALIEQLMAALEAQAKPAAPADPAAADPKATAAGARKAVGDLMQENKTRGDKL